MAGVEKWDAPMIQFLLDHWLDPMWSGPRISRHLGLQDEAAHGKAIGLGLPPKRLNRPTHITYALPPEQERMGHGPHPLPAGHPLAMAVLTGRSSRTLEMRAA